MFSAFFLTGYLLIGGCQRSPEVSESIPPSIQLDTVGGALEPHQIASATSDGNLSLLLKLGDSLAIDQVPRQAPERIARPPVPWIRADSAAGLLEAGGVLLHVGTFEDYLAWGTPDDDYYTHARLAQAGQLYDTLQTIVLVAASERPVADVARQLQEQGFRHVFAAKGGYSALKTAGIRWLIEDRVIVGSDTFSVDTGYGYGEEGRTIYRKRGGQKEREYQFPVLSQISWGVHYYESDYDYQLRPIRVAEGKIWFGFDFYDAEGLTGVGGIGFYDPVSGQGGILRHPALLHCSVLNFAIAPDRFVIQTAANGELGNGICAGVVVIDRANWLATGHSSQGNGILYHKDDPDDDIADHYFLAIHDLQLGAMFTPYDIRQWEDATRNLLHSKGLDAFMVARAEFETLSDRMPHPRGVLVEDRLLYVDGFQPAKHRRLTEDGIHAETGQPGSYWLKAVQDSLMQEECGSTSIGGLQLEWRPAATQNGVTDSLRLDMDDMERFRELSLEDLSRMDPGDAERIISDSLDIVWMVSTPRGRRVLLPEDVQTYQKYCPERDSTVHVITDVRFRYQRYEFRTVPAE